MVQGCRNIKCTCLSGFRYQKLLTMSPSQRRHSVGNERHTTLTRTRLKYRLKVGGLWVWSDAYTSVRHSQLLVSFVNLVMILMSLMKGFITLSYCKGNLNNPLNSIFLPLSHTVNHILPYLPLWTDTSHALYPDCMCVSFHRHTLILKR